MSGSSARIAAAPKPSSLTLPAPGKLNLFLHVTGRRQDGYHTLESVFVPIGYGDTVSLRLREDSAVVRTSACALIPEDTDLAVRAARLLQERLGVSRGVSLEVSKRLPIGGGLGGGSSDAATVLLGLNVLWDLRLTRPELMKLGLELGADVPFFVYGQAAFARGIGEDLVAVSVPPLWSLVVAPPVNVPTAVVFAAPELTRNSVSAKILVFPEGCGRNDLQATATARFPEIAHYLSMLGREGEARMTGSGACIFASYPNQQQALRARASLPLGVAAFVARALGRHPLWTLATP